MSTGVTLRRESKFDLSLKCFTRASVLFKDDPNVWYELGLLFDEWSTVAGKTRDRIQKSIQYFDKALTMAPKFSQAAVMLGHALLQLSKTEEAMRAYERGIEGSPTAALWYNLGYLQLTRGENDKAEKSFKESLEIDSEFPQANEGLGALYFGNGEVEKSVPLFKAALASNKNSPTAAMNYANALGKLDRHEEAADAYEYVLSLPNDKDTHGDATARIVHFREGCCDWRNRKRDQKRILVLTRKQISTGAPVSLIPFNSLTLPLTMREHLMVAASAAANREAKAQDVLARVSVPVPKPTLPKRLRVGYVSGDFRDHPVGRDLAVILREHDFSKFDVYAYALNPPKGDAYWEQLSRDIPNFVELNHLEEHEAVTRVRSDKINVLVDLMGYTQGASLTLFASRCASEQISYKGYMGSSGSAFIDHILTDTVTTPPDFSADFSERFVLMPLSFFVSGHAVNHANVLKSSPLKRSDHGLPEGKFIFACFNTLYKIDPPIFDTWMRILVKVDNSVLWLLRQPPAAEKHLRREAKKRRVSPDRLIFTDYAPFEEHIQVKALADFFLDTPLYNSHGTCSDILWAGVPMLSMVQTTMAARVAASLLRCTGQAHLLARTHSEYEALAVYYATHRLALAQARSFVENTRTSMHMFNTSRWMSHWETALALQWDLRVSVPKFRYHIVLKGANIL